MHTFHQQKSRPMTAAERQAICRAKKKGTYTSGCNELGTIPGHLKIGTPEHDAAFQALLEAKGMRWLPAPQTTAIETTKPAEPETAPAITQPPVDAAAEQILSSLPPGVARRLRTLVSKHQSGKSLTADELEEAKGLLDIAEYFSIQRMRKQLAA